MEWHSVAVARARTSDAPPNRSGPRNGLEARSGMMRVHAELRRGNWGARAPRSANSFSTSPIAVHVSGPEVLRFYSPAGLGFQDGSRNAGCPAKVRHIDAFCRETGLSDSEGGELCLIFPLSRATAHDHRFRRIQFSENHGVAGKPGALGRMNGGLSSSSVSASINAKPPVWAGGDVLVRLIW